MAVCIYIYIYVYYSENGYQQGDGDADRHIHISGDPDDDTIRTFFPLLISRARPVALRPPLKGEEGSARGSGHAFAGHKKHPQL